jgi:Protein of unknown function (DUF642)
MSDVAGPGWWQASDDRWYPPELHPDYQAEATTPTPVGAQHEAAPQAQELAGDSTAGAATHAGPGQNKSRGRTIIFILLLLIAVLIALLLLLPGGSTSSGNGPNLIRDGGFELPKVGVGTYDLFSAGQRFSSWMVVGKGNVAPISGKYVSEDLTFPAQSGRQWLDLTGVTNSREGVRQTIHTATGTTYTLRFAVGNQDDPHGVYGVKSTVDVFIDGRPFLVATNHIDNGSKVQVWEFFTRRFTAASDQTTLRFMNGDEPNDNVNGLDTVSVLR